MLLSHQEKEAVTKLLLSTSAPTIQLALEFLSNNPTWRAPLKEALEVFFFFDSRRATRANVYQNSPINYQGQIPLIPFVRKDGSTSDAHELVGIWLEAIEENFYTLTHPLFYLGAPSDLFEEEEEQEKKPSWALPSLDFMEQQLQYVSYIEFQPDWLVTAKDWGLFIVQHLDNPATSALYTPQELERYKAIAWQYYQNALPHAQEDAVFLAQVAYLLDKHPPKVVAETERLPSITYYYEQAFTLLLQQDKDCTSVLQHYILFCYETLQDSEQTIALFKRFLGDFIPANQWHHLIADCQQLGNSSAVRSWFFTFGLKTSAATKAKINNLLGVTPSTTPLTKKEQAQGFTSLDQWQQED